MQGAATKMMRDIIEEPQRSQMALCRRNPLGGRGLRSQCFVARISPMTRIGLSLLLACERRSRPRGRWDFYDGLLGLHVREQVHSQQAEDDVG